ncbi:hypothetical protein [Arsukibacterium sp.]|uniref:hypothetical protein n=1 Tax=Arsukibacterium sp. TaxID=1977258 RepID=UPI00299D801D|nr:hypothetical protein [Arsukibacterium sp.]MDX1678865.1 hypothetical protein [Arsukibacterium sp.]
MSVINKMLQDLEKRQPAQANASPLAELPPPASGRILSYRWLLLILLLVLLAGYWYGITQQQAATVTDNRHMALAGAGSQQQSLVPNDQNNAEQTQPDVIAAALTDSEAAFSALVEPVADNTAKTLIAALPVTKEHNNASATFASTAATNAATPDVTVPPPDPHQLLSSATDSQQARQVMIVEPEPALPPAARGQLSVSKQPLSIAAQQHRMQLRANASEAAGDISAAIVIWQQLVALQPASADSYLNLARLWLKQQQVVTASQVLLKARQNGVVSAEINMQLAQLAVKQGQWQQALEFLSDEFELAAEPEYFGFKATVLQQLERHDAALEWYQRLQQLQPEQGRWSLGAAVASEYLGLPQQAHLYYQHAWQFRQALSVSSHHFIQQRLKATEP